MLCKSVSSADERVAVALSAAGRVYSSHASSGGECRAANGEVLEPPTSAWRSP